MSEPSTSAPEPSTKIPGDDPRRSLVVAKPDEDGSLRHVAVAGGTYTILLAGTDTAGRYCLIDMLIFPEAGPPPHRHDFEETFTILEGELAFTFRGETSVASAGHTVHVPANAPHSFRNTSGRPARTLCLCSPAGQEDLFLAIGDLVPSRTSPPPELDDATRAARKAKAEALAPRYKTEFVKPS